MRSGKHGEVELWESRQEMQEPRSKNSKLESWQRRCRLDTSLFYQCFVSMVCVMYMQILAVKINSNETFSQYWEPRCNEHHHSTDLPLYHRHYRWTTTIIIVQPPIHTFYRVTSLATNMSSSCTIIMYYNHITFSVYIILQSIFSLWQHFSDEVNGQREHIGVVVLGRDGVESLQVTQLEGCWGLVKHISCLTELPRCSLLSLGRHHLERGVLIRGQPSDYIICMLRLKLHVLYEYRSKPVKTHMQPIIILIQSLYSTILNGENQSHEKK